MVRFQHASFHLQHTVILMDSSYAHLLLSRMVRFPWFRHTNMCALATAHEMQTNGGSVIPANIAQPTHKSEVPFRIKESV